MNDQLPLMMREYVEGLKTRDIKRIAPSLADELRVVLSARSLNKQQFLDYLTALYQAFPDWTYEHGEPQVSEDGSITIRWRQVGTHTAPWLLPGSLPTPATGKVIRIPWQRFTYKVDSSRIIEIRPEPIQGGVPEAIFDHVGTSDML